MKISIKTIAGNTHPLDVDDNMQLGALKKKIEDELGYEGINMKLVFKGKVLAEDGVTLTQAGLVDNEFLVLVAKKKMKKDEPEPAVAAPAQPTPAPAPTSPAPEAAQPVPEPAKETPAEAQAPAEETKAEAPAQPAAATPEAAPHVAPDIPTDIGAAASVFATGSQLENVIKEIMEMGFPKDQVVRAMRAAYNNPDRAVDYLMSGIPEGIEMDHPAQHPPAPAPATAGAGAGAGAAAPATTGAAGATATAAGTAAAAAAAGLDPATLANNPQIMAMLQQMLNEQGGSAPQLSPLAQALQAIPQFEQLRQVIATNPQMLQAIIQQLRTTNPQLFNLINQNPQEFIQLIQNGIPGTGGAARAGGAGAGQPAGGMPPGPGVIQVTPEEKEAIDRLAALGFPERVAAEAYLVCGKNEELAANFLFENGAMDFDDSPGDEGEGEN